MRKFLVLAVALALMMVSFVPASAQGGDTIVDIAVADGRFTTLVAALQATGLDAALQGSGPFTVFAPTDAAFAALGSDTIAALLDAPDTLASILLYHVVSGEVYAADVVNLSYAPTLNGTGVDIQVVDGSVILNGSSKVIITDIQASNGVIHVIDAVLLPPPASQKILITSDAPVYDGPNGNEIGLTIEQCKTADVTMRTSGFAQVQTMGGWISADNFTDVPADYGQPGGTPINPACQ